MGYAGCYERGRMLADAAPFAHRAGEKPKWLALGAVFVLFGLVLREAWVAEDAYITLRTVDNWLNGFGLRWNTDERVQGYTHPLWMFLLGGAAALTRESFASTLCVGLLTTLLSLLLLLASARTPGHAIAALALLSLSRAFVDFSTSGLENPLTHCLVALFVYQYAAQRTQKLAWLALTAALLALSRADALLVVLPALAHEAFLHERARGLKATLQTLLLGFAPLLAWELFSLFYYGFLVPNTAYAKLNTGVLRTEQLRQGGTYLLNAAAWDPALLVTTAVGLGSVFIGQQRRPRLLALGASMYVLYVVWIGGDFMLGRFLTLPLFTAACLIALSELPLAEPMHAAAIVLPFLFFYFHPSAKERYPPMDDFKYSGVADERSYFKELQLMLFKRTQPLPASHPWVIDGLRVRDEQAKSVVFDNVGLFGFYAGPHVHVIDRHALAEPLLARLPALSNPGWRVGHYARLLPDGYLETTILNMRPAGPTATPGACAMKDQELCKYYAALREVVAGELWSLHRFQTIFLLNIGHYDALIDRERYQFPGTLHEPIETLHTPLAEGSPIDQAGARALSYDGLRIELAAPSHAKQVSLSLDGDDDYVLELRSGTKELGSQRSPSLRREGMHTRTFAVSAAAQREGFDKITVRPLSGDGSYALGYVRLE